MSRATRKAYNMGKRDGERLGYIKGYSDGLIDGNPFTSIIKAINNIEDPDDEETPAASEV